MNETTRETAPAGPAAGSAPLLVADSFRVRANPRTGDAEVREWDRHLERFTRSVLLRTREAAESETEGGRPADGAWGERIEIFLDDALARVAAYGEGFPRLELRAAERAGGDPELALLLRPLPELLGSIELRSTIELRTAGGVGIDHPGVKGPNIAGFADLNRRLGAEALRLDAEGRAIEGATTSIVWWTDDGDESGHVVGAPADGSVDRVDSVTEGLLVDAARGSLVDSRPGRRRTGALAAARPTPEELLRAEVWAVNALHGIRVVTSIDGVAMRPPNERRLRRFRDALERTWQPLHSPLGR